MYMLTHLFIRVTSINHIIEVDLHVLWGALKSAMAVNVVVT